MTTTMTPPPLPPLPPTDAAPAAERGPTRASSRVVAILLIVVGALIVLGALGWAVLGTIVSATVRTETRTVAVAGVESLDVDLSAGDLRVEFADVAEAELQVRGSFGADRWTFETEGDELIVASPRWMFGLGWLLGGNGEAVLRLPQALDGIDADLDLSAGDLDVEGTFGELEQHVSAGSLTVDGSAREVTTDVSAGNAEIRLSDVVSAEFSVSAGSLDVTLTGTAPRSLDVGVSAGSVDLVVPSGVYDVSSDVSAGSFDNRIGSEPGTRNRIHVQVSAGDVTLRSAR